MHDYSFLITHTRLQTQWHVLQCAQNLFRHNLLFNFRFFRKSTCFSCWPSAIFLLLLKSDEKQKEEWKFHSIPLDRNVNLWHIRQFILAEVLLQQPIEGLAVAGFVRGYDHSTNSEIILPILPISVFPLNSNFAVAPLLNIINSSESGINSAKPGVWIEKYCILE